MPNTWRLDERYVIRINVYIHGMQQLLISVRKIYNQPVEYFFDFNVERKRRELIKKEKKKTLERTFHFLSFSEKKGTNRHRDSLNNSKTKGSML